VDGAVDATAAEQARVGGVDNRIDGEPCEIAHRNFDAASELQREFGGLESEPISATPPVHHARDQTSSERAAQSVRELGTDAEIAFLPSYSAKNWARALEGVDAVVHTVGILKESSRSRYRDAHEGSVEGLCLALCGAECRRVVYLSIVGAALDSANPCLASKARAECRLLEAFPESVVLRFPMVLGASDPASSALRARALQKRVWLLAGGRAWDQPVDARDAVAAIAHALRPTQPVGILELAGPEALPYRELLLRVSQRLGGNPRLRVVPTPLARAAAWIAERLMRDPPLTRAMLDVLLRDDVVNAAPAWRALGLEPHPLDESLDHWFGRESA
jgi:uncharacterized protein YbjT (DUF2867 family)